MSRLVLVVAGEPSGDLAAGRLVEALRRRDASIRVVAVGGENLRAAGAEIFEDISELGAMGFVEVVRQIPRLRALEDRLVKFMAESRPNVVVPVDYPGFNLRLAAKAHALQIPVVYYIAPQVWAWAEGRVREIGRVVRKLLVILPFEEDYFRRRGIAATFVGHPLLEGVAAAPSRKAAREELGIDPEVPVLGLIPGSRVQEIRRILPSLLHAAKLAGEQIPGLITLASRASFIAEHEFERVAPHPGNVRFVSGPAARIMRAADVLLVTSGTATLEAGLLGTPLGVVYRTSPVTWGLGRMLVRLPRIGLVNLVAGEELAPEFLQNDATGPRLSAFVVELLRDPSARSRRQDALKTLRKTFEGHHASEEAAEEILQELGTSRSS